MSENPEMPKVVDTSDVDAAQPKDGDESDGWSQVKGADGVMYEKRNFADRYDSFVLSSRSSSSSAAVAEVVAPPEAE